MSVLRQFWIAWCVLWAIGWLFVGFLFFPLWLLVPLSLVAIFLPVGNGNSVNTLRHDANYMPRIGRGDFPSSPYDPRFTEDEKANYFNRNDDAA